MEPHKVDAFGPLGQVVVGDEVAGLYVVDSHQRDPAPLGVGAVVAIDEDDEFFLTLSGVLDPVRDTVMMNIKYVGCTKVICLFPHKETVFARLPPPATATGLSAKWS